MSSGARRVNMPVNMAGDNPNSLNRMSGRYWWLALLILPLVVYLHGLAPATLPGDTGDFQTAGAIWGVSHPPGYPLLTIATGIMERLPIQPFRVSTSEVSVPGWRSNLLLAITGLAALCVLFMLVRRLTGSAIAGAVGSGALAFSRTFWWHSEMAENDALTALFLLLMLYFSVKWVQERNLKNANFLVLIFRTCGVASSVASAFHARHFHLSGNQQSYPVRRTSMGDSRAFIHARADAVYLFADRAISIGRRSA